MNIGILIQEYKNIINEYIKQFLYDQKVGEIRGMLKYVLITESKKIRSVLVLLFGKKLRIEPEFLKDYCLAIEVFHTYTLIHDDLPSLDNDDFRRGKLSLHKKYGEANAILIGDGLQTLAFELFSKENKNFNSRTILRAINKFAEAMGVIKGVTFGQIIDLTTNNSSSEINIDSILKIHKYKTAVFFAFCTSLPAILVDTEESRIEEFYDFGLKFGMLFQFLDDIEDYPKKPNECNICNVHGYEEAKNLYIKQVQSFSKSNIFGEYGEQIINHYLSSKED